MYPLYNRVLLVTKLIDTQSPIDRAISDRSEVIPSVFYSFAFGPGKSQNKSVIVNFHTSHSDCGNIARDIFFSSEFDTNERTRWEPIFRKISPSRDSRRVIDY